MPHAIYLAMLVLCGGGVLASGRPALARRPTATATIIPSVRHSKDRLEMTTGSQRLVFAREGTGYRLRTYVRDGTRWRDGFDAGRPLLTGKLFGDYPASFRVLSATSRLASVEFSGRHDSPRYEWTMRVSAGVGSPLFHFRTTCRLREPLSLDAPQPVVALWTRQAKPEVCLDQGPDSIYGAAGIPHGFGFPAAYLWSDRFEAAVFFDMTPMRWMQRGGVARFHDVRIMTRRDGDAAGLGMHFKHLSGGTIPAGDMQIDFHLYQGTRPRKPTALAQLCHFAADTRSGRGKVVYTLARFTPRRTPSRSPWGVAADLRRPQRRQPSVLVW